MITAADIVDWAALGNAAWEIALFGLVILVVAAIAVATSLRAQDVRKTAGGAVATAYGAVTVVCVAGLAAAVVLGIHLMTQK
jgi:hypothetical protein